MIDRASFETLMTVLRPLERPAAQLTKEGLIAFFSKVSPLSMQAKPAPKQICGEELNRFLNDIREPMHVRREVGGRVNPWEAAGLGRRETRVSGALAALWSYEFGGATSRRFLALWLAETIPGTSAEEWDAELRQGYHLRTEHCPLGERCDRVDIIIETSAHLICIEVKIDAGLGKDQLQRYSNAITRWAKGIHKKPYLVFLAGVPSLEPDVFASDWHSISFAARSAGSEIVTPAAHLITLFGHYAATLNR